MTASIRQAQDKSIRQAQDKSIRQAQDKPNRPIFRYHGSKWTIALWIIPFQSQQRWDPIPTTLRPTYSQQQSTIQ